MALVIKTVSDSRAAQQDLAKLRETVDNIKKSADNVTASFGNFTKTISIGLAGFAGFSMFVKYSDELTNLESKLRLATKSQSEMNIAFREIQRIAVATRTDLSAVASLYSRIATSATRFGSSQKDIIRFTEAVTKTMTISGASVQETQGALQQLGQALASGRLQGDELRSILENAPALAISIADGLGVTIGKLRELGETGEISSVKVFKAILKEQDAINAKFAKMGVTYGSAFTNLGNSLKILFATVSKEVFNSSSSLAEVINSFAVGVSNFASNFKLNMKIAKASVLLFVIDSVLLFQDFYKELEIVGAKVGEIANDLYVKWKPAIVSAINDLQLWAQAAAATAVIISNSLYSSFKGSELGKNLINGIEASFNYLSGKLIYIFNAIQARLPTIDVRAIFPGLDTGLKYLETWAKAAERWFFWLYDKVIGNSWIPDLVDGVVAWTKKLLSSPLNNVKDFAAKASSSFAGIKFSDAFSKVIGYVSKLKAAIFPLVAMLAAVGAALTVIGMAKGPKLNIDGSSSLSVTGESAPKTEGLLERMAKWLRANYELTKKNINESPITRTLKQVLGLKDTTPGSMYGVPIDTNAQVGRGPFRSQEMRPVGHDLINAFPPGWQIPMIVGFTGVFALAIMKAFEAGTTRTVLLSVLTSAMGIAIAQTVPDSQIKKTFGGAAFGALNILEKGISKVFGGNVLKDPFGFLSLLAKTALLFAKGRELLGNAALAIAKAPTNFVQTLFTAGEAKASTAKSERLTKEISQLPARLNQAFSSSNTLYQSSVRQLSRLTDATGNVIGMQRALMAVRGGDRSVFGSGTAAQAQLAQSIRALSQQQKAQADLGNVKATRAELVGQRDVLKKQGEELQKQVTEAKKAFTDGVKNFGAGVGGVLGGVAGFQIGAEIARGMTDATGWQKVGVVIAVAMGGQAIGAAIGLAISTLLLGTAARIGGLMAAGFLLLNPFVRGASILFAALYAGYQLFTNLPEKWADAVKNTLTAAPGSAGAGYKALSGTNDPLLFPNGQPQVSDEERRKNLEQLKNLNDSLDSTIAKLKEFTSNLFGGSPVKRAAGGWINGPGTGTSDSIPALLSNGEFVVNAKASRENASLLQQINSGKVSRFAAGGLARKPMGFQHSNFLESDPTKQVTFSKDVKRSDPTKFKQEVLAGGITQIEQLAQTIKRASANGIALSKEDIDNLLAITLQENTQEYGVDGAVFMRGTFNKKRYTQWRPETDLKLLEKIRGVALTGNVDDSAKVSLIDSGLFPNAKSITDFVSNNALAIGTGVGKDNKALSALVFKARETAFEGQQNASMAEFYKDSSEAFLFRVLLKMKEAKKDSVSALFESGLWNGSGPMVKEHLKQFKAIKTDVNQELYKGFYDSVTKADPSANSAGSQPVNTELGIIARFKQMFGFANGGGISGPGTGTSDSIPALLSNGEFVVNARSAAKNWSLLNEINSGKKPSMFSTGGGVGIQGFQSGGAAVASGKPLAVVVQNANEIAKASDKNLFQMLSESFKEGLSYSKDAIDKALKNVDLQKTLGISAPKPPSTVPAGPTEGNVLKELKAANSLDQSATILQKNLARAGYTNLSTEGLKGLTAATSSSVAEALDRIEELQGKGAKLAEGSFLKKQVEEAVNDLNSQIVETLKTSDLKFNAPSKFVEDKKERKPSEITLGDQLSILNKAFPLVELSVDEFRNLTDKLREGVFKKALEIERASENIDKEIIGFLEKGTPVPQVVYKKRRELEAKRIEYQKLVADQLEDVRTPFAGLKASFASLGVNISEDIYNALDDSQVSEILSAKQLAEDAQRALKKPSSELPKDLRVAAQTRFAENVNKIGEVLQEAAKLGLSPKEQMKFELSRFSISLDDFTFNMLSDMQRATINEYITALNDARKKLKDEDLGEEERRAAQTLVNDIVEKTTKLLSKSAPGYKSSGKLAGESFASDISEGFSTATIAALKGQSAENESIWKTYSKSLLDTFTSTIINTFVKGAMDAFVGEEGIVTKGLKDAGSSIFGLSSSKSLKNLFGSKSDLPEQLSGPVEDEGNPMSSLFSGLKGGFDTFKKSIGEFDFGEIFSSLGDSLSGAISGLGSLIGEIDFGKIFASMSGIFGFASGGYVSGKGTGSSDSIPAMLSNGEFVINAAATRKFAPLLGAINAGNFGKFAEGGTVSTQMVSQPVITRAPSSSSPFGGSQQIINLTITGDISRQTKGEIYKMLPSIAEGVNSHNREKGYR